LLPLEDIIVIEIGSSISSSYCSKIFADYGANVIKIEPIDGDSIRFEEPFLKDSSGSQNSTLFLSLNTGKKSFVADFDNPDSLQLIHKLIDKADLIIDGTNPGYLAEKNIVFNDLLDRNPNLIITSITGYGQTGPISNWKWDEITLEAIGGNMYVSGDYDGEPISFGVPLFQFVAGQVALSSTMMALLAIDRFGGQHIDISMAEVVTSCIPYALQYYTYTGAIWGRGPKERLLFGVDLWPANNGHVGLSVIRSTDFEEIAAFLGVPEMYEDKFATPQGREENYEELKSLYLNRLQEIDKNEFFHEAHAWRLMASRELNPKELLECEQLIDREYYVDLDHGLLKGLPHVSNILGLDSTKGIPVEGSPSLGQNTEEILIHLLEIDKDSIAEFKNKGIIK
jgi:crotonobetainyl-CoA:carnitine CoA-transferase CaiB-like acyl-CoA transferase